ncbi:MAG: aminotransferase class I/II-fold pyridoxal phosphate-dependent enzyme [Ginsengibacter sp.]
MGDVLKKAYSANDFRTNGHQLIDMLANYLQDIQSSEDPLTIRWEDHGRQLQFWQNDFDSPLITTPHHLVKNILDRSIHLHSSRAMGHQVSPPVPIGILFSMLSSFLNNGSAVYEMGMTSNVLEKIVTENLAQKLGYDKNASGLITSGGSLGNLTALLAARAFSTDVWSAGCGSDEKLAVMVSEEAHYSIDRAVRIMGLGTEGIIKIPANEKFQMDTSLLEKYLEIATAEGKKVFCIVGSACSTSTGSYDNLESIAAFAKKHNIWFHVDGAHGAAVVYSPKFKHLIEGIEKADSVIIDFHKMMLCPALSTAIIFKRRADAYKTFLQQAKYLFADQDTEEWYHSGKRTIECTKHMNVLAIYSIMRMYGDDIFMQNVETLFGLAIEFAELIKSNERFELAYEPQSNIVCFRYPDGENPDNTNQQILKYLLEDGRFYIVSTVINGEFYLRVSIMNPLTTSEDLVDLIDIIQASVK